MELSGKQIFSNVLRVPGMPCAAVATVLDGGLDALGPAYPKDSLVVHVDAVVVAQIVVYAAVAFVRTLGMYFLNFLSYILVFPNPAALLPSFPLVIG
jgi:hypothetical protein